MYQDLSTHRDWPTKKAIVDFPIRVKVNSKRISGNSLSPLRAQGYQSNTDLIRFIPNVTRVVFGDSLGALFSLH